MVMHAVPYATIASWNLAIHGNDCLSFRIGNTGRMNSSAVGKLQLICIHKRADPRELSVISHDWDLATVNFLYPTTNQQWPWTLKQMQP